MNASYTGQGANGIEPLQSRDHITLRNPFVQAEDFDEGNVGGANVLPPFILMQGVSIKISYIRFNKINLKDIKQLRYRVQPQAGGKMEVRLGKIDGALICSVSIPVGNAADPTARKEITPSVNEIKGIHNAYFTFIDLEGKKKNLFNIVWIYFSNSK